VRDDVGMQVGRMLGKTWVCERRWKEDGHTVTFMHHITYIRGTRNSALEKENIVY